MFLNSAVRRRYWLGRVRPCFFDAQPQFGDSLNPRPLRIIGTHFFARAALVCACLAEDT